MVFTKAGRTDSLYLYSHEPCDIIGLLGGRFCLGLIITDLSCCYTTPNLIGNSDLPV